jgi:DNA-binding CsgD family transcriptional regulator/tetratricopeptide (TPR) repeat protein
MAPLLDPLAPTARKALQLIAADTTSDVDVLRAALRALGLAGDLLVELEQAGLIAIAGTSVRMRRPMLEVVAYDRLDPAERRAIHRALAGAMASAPQHGAARAWQLASGTDGPDAEVALAMSSVGQAAAARGDLRLAALAHHRAADFAAGHAARSREIRRALALWAAFGDPVAVRRLIAEAQDDDVVTYVARSAGMRWLEGDAAAVAELRRAAPRATAEQRAMLDALFADAALACGRAREATEAAGRVVRSEHHGVARNLAEAVLVLGGQAEPTRLAPLEAADGDETREIVRSRAAVRHAMAYLRVGDVDAAEHVLGVASDTDPVPWDAGERTALRARLAAMQGHATTARQILVAALDELPAGAAITRAVLQAALADAQFLSGDQESAMEVLDEVAPVFRAASMARDEASVQITVARIAWSVGETDVAISCFEQARRIDPLAPIGELVALLVSLGREQEARTWLDRLDRGSADGAAPLDLLRARASAATDTTGFQHLAEVLRRGRLVVPEAEMMIDLTAWHHRRSRWTEVYRTAEQAARLLLVNGIQPWVDRLDRLEPPADSPTADVPAALAPLTDAERRVALAVARGLTNKDAAAELFVSVKTIDSHLQRIYPKLFVRSRGELAALVAAALATSSLTSGAALGRTTGNPPDAGR